MTVTTVAALSGRPRPDYHSYPDPFLEQKAGQKGRPSNQEEQADSCPSRIGTCPCSETLELERKEVEQNEALDQGRSQLEVVLRVWLDLVVVVVVVVVHLPLVGDYYHQPVGHLLL